MSTENEMHKINKGENPLMENSEASYDVLFRKAGDPLVIINPQSIVGAFGVTLDEAKHLDPAEKTVANMNRYCQPHL